MHLARGLRPEPAQLQIMYTLHKRDTDDLLAHDERARSTFAGSGQTADVPSKSILQITRVRVSGLSRSRDSRTLHNAPLGSRPPSGASSPLFLRPSGGGTLGTLLGEIFGAAAAVLLPSAAPPPAHEDLSIAQQHGSTTPTPPTSCITLVGGESSEIVSHRESEIVSRSKTTGGIRSGSPPQISAAQTSWQSNATRQCFPLAATCIAFSSSFKGYRFGSTTASKGSSSWNSRRNSTALCRCQGP